MNGAPPGLFPRRCEGNGVYGEGWCHGFFNGMVDANGDPTHYGGVPGPVALVEIRNGPSNNMVVVGTRWLRLLP